MTSRIGIRYFKGIRAEDDFNEWSEANPKAEIADIRTGVITQGILDGCISITVIYQIENNIIQGKFKLTDDV